MTADALETTTMEAGGAADATVDSSTHGSSNDASAMDAAADAKVAVDASTAIDGGSCSTSGSAHAAASSGYTGTDMGFLDLFDSVPCAVAADCVPSCVGAGGTQSSCAQGEQCVLDVCPDGGDGCLMCLPPTYWLDPGGALGVPGSGLGGTPANDVQAFDNGYNDSLLVTDFRISLPSGAQVRGVEFKVDRSADDGNASDQSVRLLQGPAPVGTDHASSTPWPQTFTPQTYGGPSDTWGLPLTAANVESSGFGISITPQYALSAGNDRVQIDSVSVTIFYGGSPGCP